MINNFHLIQHNHHRIHRLRNHSLDYLDWSERTKNLFLEPKIKKSRIGKKRMSIYIADILSKYRHNQLFLENLMQDHNFHLRTKRLMFPEKKMLFFSLSKSFAFITNLLFLIFGMKLNFRFE